LLESHGFFCALEIPAGKSIQIAFKQQGQIGTTNRTLSTAGAAVDGKKDSPLIRPFKGINKEIEIMFSDFY